MNLFKTTAVLTLAVFTLVVAPARADVGRLGDASLSAWGLDTDGQITVPAGNDFTQVAGGGFHSLALKSDGSLSAWGNNEYGQLAVPPGNDFTHDAAGA